MTTALRSHAARRSRDLGFAIAALLFAAVIAGILFYGNWWRDKYLINAYEARFQNALQSYQQVVAEENPDPQQVYLLGAEIDVIMRRLPEQLSNPEMAWDNIQFLRQHAHRLDSLFGDTPNWDEPTLLSVKLGDVKRRLDDYLDRSNQYLAKIEESDSPYGELAQLQRIEDTIVLGRLGNKQVDLKLLADLFSKTMTVLSHCQTDPATTEPTHQMVISRGTAIVAWLLCRQDQLEKLSNEESPIHGLQAKSFLQLDNRTESLVAISQVMVAAGGKRKQQTIDLALKGFDKSYRYEARGSDGIIGKAMEIRFQAIAANWPEVLNAVSEASEAETVSRQEVAFLRQDATAAILKLITSKPWLDRLDTKLQVEKCLETAVNLSRYSPETLRMLMAIGVANSTRFKTSLEVAGLPSVDVRVIEAGRASPSSIVALTTGAITAGIDQDDQKINEVIESETMLNVGLNEMLTSIAIWRSSTTQTLDHVEVSGWLQLMEAITQLPNVDRHRTMGNAWLALAAWQSHAGEHEFAIKSLQAANPVVGDSQLYMQIEDLIKRNLP